MWRVGGRKKIKIQTLNLKNIQKLHKIRVKNQYLQLDLTIRILRTKCTWLGGHIYTNLMPPSLYTPHFNHTAENKGVGGRRDGKDHDAGCSSCSDLMNSRLGRWFQQTRETMWLIVLRKWGKKKSTEPTRTETVHVWWLKPLPLLTDLRSVVAEVAFLFFFKNHSLNVSISHNFKGFFIVQQCHKVQRWLEVQIRP